MWRTHFFCRYKMRLSLLVRKTCAKKVSGSPPVYLGTTWKKMHAKTVQKTTIHDVTCRKRHENHICLQLQEGFDTFFFTKKWGVRQTLRKQTVKNTTHDLRVACERGNHFTFFSSSDEILLEIPSVVCFFLYIVFGFSSHMRLAFFFKNFENGPPRFARPLRTSLVRGIYIRLDKSKINAR